MNFVESLGYALATVHKLFPDARAGAKLQQEAAELQDALDSGDEASIVEELADCLICVSHAIGSSDRFVKLADAVVAKCDLLETRKWVFDESTHTYQHVKGT